MALWAVSLAIALIGAANQNIPVIIIGVFGLGIGAGSENKI